MQKLLFIKRKAQMSSRDSYLNKDKVIPKTNFTMAYYESIKMLKFVLFVYFKISFYNMSLYSIIKFKNIE